MVGLTNQIHSETHHSCEKRKYAFMVLWEYLIIFPPESDNRSVIFPRLFFIDYKQCLMNSD